MISGRQPHCVRLCFIHLFILLVVLSTRGWAKKPDLPDWNTAEPSFKHQYTRPPLIKGNPFYGIWNVPDACYKKNALGEELMANRMKYFGFISNYKDNDQEVKLFYKEHFGKFPYLSHHDPEKPINGGIPHKGNLSAHVLQASTGYNKMIPSKEKAGLAILDFEQWRPLWVRNWGGKDHYRKLTTKYCVEDKGEEICTKQYVPNYYEKLAWSYMLDPMDVGRKHSNKKLWGYYLFPDCYNTHYSNDRMDAWLKRPGCPETEFKRNFRLGHLWNRSTGIFPSVYLDYVLRDNIGGRYYTRHRIRESVKMSFAPKGHGGELGKAVWPKQVDGQWVWETGKPTRNLSVPIFVYVRNAFKDEEDEHLSELDLVNTIGESAAQGVGGFIAWGKMRFANNLVSCTRARKFLDHVMLPYMMNVSTSAKMCSKALCNSRGRCSRADWNKSIFLHLDPKRFQINKGKDGQLDVEGELSNEDLNYYKEHFKCVCYSKPKVDTLENCSLPTPPPTTPPGPTDPGATDPGPTEPEPDYVSVQPPVIKVDLKDPKPPPKRKGLSVGLVAGVGGGGGVVAGSGLVYVFIIR